MFSVSKRPTVAEIHELYSSQKAIPSQIVQFFLNRSKNSDKKIQSILRFNESLAAEQAQWCDEVLAKYKKQSQDWFAKLVKDYPLFGIPYNLKDNILVEDEVATSASKILDEFKAPFSATVYLKLKNSGAILISRSNLDTWATGASTENSDYQITHNPYDLSRVPGGSSGGAAACVASGQVVFSLGTDTGGSVRQPAGFCNVVGIKPTYGSISRWGVMPMAASLDQVGAMTNSVRDNMLVTRILMGEDSKDETTVDTSALMKKIDDLLKQKKNRPSVKPTKTTNKLKIGLPKEFYDENLDPVIAKTFKDLHGELKKLGHELIQVDLPMIKNAIGVYYTIMTVELASHLERFDGIRYSQFDEVKSSQDLYFSHRNKYFSEEPKRRIMLGTFTSSAGYYDAYYNTALKVREKIRQEFAQVFKKVDVLLTPTSPEFPFKIGDKSQDPIKMYLSDIYTCGINPVRIPGFVVPLGLFEMGEDDPQVDKGELLSDDLEVEVVEGEEFVVEEPSTMQGKMRLPIGCQLLGPEFSEDILFKLGHEIEMLVGE